MGKIYPSGMAKVVGAATEGFYNQCLRYQWSKYRGDGEIPELYRTIGHLNEHRYLQKLQIDHPGAEIYAEVPVWYDLGEGCSISGRIDAVSRIDGVDSLYELKSTLSDYSRKAIVKGGDPGWSHLGQLVTYMIITDTMRGIYDISYISFTKEFNVKFETREFLVTLNPEDATITCQTEGLEDKIFPVAQFMQYYKARKKADLESTLPPASLTSCNRCPLQKVCEKNPKGKDEFNRLVENLEPVPELPGRQPKIRHFKRS